MKAGLTVALSALLLAGCGSQDPSVNVDARDEGGGANALGDLNLQTAAPSQAELLQRVRAAMGGVLQHPNEAVYSNVRSGSGGAVCGTVNLGPSGHNEVRQFVVTSAGGAVISRAAAVHYEDATDSFADQYIQSCASTSELNTIGPGIPRPPPLPPEAINAVTLPPEALPPEPQAPAPGTPAPGSRWGQPPATPATPPPPASGDANSFSSAVRHAQH